MCLLCYTVYTLTHTYRKVAYSNTSHLEAHAGLFRLLMKGIFDTYHSMATANLKKSEDFVTNTIAASKYIPRRPRIKIN